MEKPSFGWNPSRAEVVNISSRGIWLYAAGKEYFLPYKEFPWFKDARLSEIQRVALIRGHHLRWENLDVDLSLDSLEHLEHYPLKYQ